MVEDKSKKDDKKENKSKDPKEKESTFNKKPPLKDK